MPLPHPYTRKDAEAWVALQSSKDPAEYFAICDAAGPIGGIGLNTQRGDSRRSAELGYYLGKQFWGRGITTAAVKVVTTYGFETLGLIRIYARVRKSNGASSRVLEKAGYRREGILRQAGLTQGVPVDLLMYAMLREDWPGHCLSPYARRSTWNFLLRSHCFRPACTVCGTGGRGSCDIPIHDVVVALRWCDRSLADRRAQNAGRRKLRISFAAFATVQALYARGIGHREVATSPYSS